jgi:hypothetical protein
MSFLILSGSFVTRYVKTERNWQNWQQSDWSGVCRFCRPSGNPAVLIPWPVVLTGPIIYPL